jgi:hypothetical protein
MAAALVKTNKRKVGLVLKSKTSGVIQGAKMVNFLRKNYEGAFSVQVATEPERPGDVAGFFTTWFHQYVLDGLLLESQHVKEESFSTSAMTQYVICQESGQRVMKYGFYRRVFVNSDGVVEKGGQEARYLNLWTRAIDLTCTYESIRDCVQSRKVWFFTQDDLPKIQYFLWAEAYKIYCREWNVWVNVHKFTNKELGLLGVSAHLSIYGFACNF